MNFYVRAAQLPKPNAQDAMMQRSLQILSGYGLKPCKTAVYGHVIKVFSNLRTEHASHARLQIHVNSTSIRRPATPPLTDFA
jgi:hypothetical protein